MPDTTTKNYWIYLWENWEDLAGPWAHMKINEIIWIKNWDKDANNPNLFIQDVIWWATMFIWTVVTVWLVVSAIMLILAWWDEKKAEKWKNWITFSIIWLLLVLFSYSIIRIVQYFAQGN